MVYSPLEGYSNVWSDTEPIVSAINHHAEISAFRRVKANLQLVQPERVYSDFHYDYGNGEVGDSNMWVGIYYLNTNDDEMERVVINFILSWKMEQRSNPSQIVCCSFLVP